MKIFIAVGEAEGFSLAARQLGISGAVVTRSIAALEARLGFQLLTRTTRRVKLTEVGARYLAYAKQAVADLEAGDALFAVEHGALRGQVSVTAPVLFGRHHLAPVVLEFLKQHPKVSVRTFLHDDVVDLLEHGLDVAIRIGNLPDSPLQGLRVGSVRRVLCVAPSYAKRHGLPRSPDDLKGHEIIASTGGIAPRPLAFAHGDRIEHQHVSPRLLVNNPDVAISAAIAGFGLTRALSYQVEEHVKDRRLRIILEEYEPPPVPVHVLHVHGKSPPARVREFVDLTANRLRAVLEQRML